MDADLCAEWVRPSWGLPGAVIPDTTAGMVPDLPPRDGEGDILTKEPSEESDAPERMEAPETKKGYLRVIVQLVLILPCAVLIFPAVIFGVIELANAFRSIERGPHYLTSAVTYGLGFVCVVSGIFLPDRFPWRWAGILIVVIGLPLFIDGALAMSDRLRIFGAGREVYEILVIFTGPVVVTAWNVIRLWKGRTVEAV